MPQRYFLCGLSSALMLVGGGGKGLSISQAQAAGGGSTPSASAPLYAPTVGGEIALLKLVEPLSGMSVAEITALVPPQCGFLFSACPNCDGGSADDSLRWEPALGDKVQCRFCKEIFPNAQYPENASVEVKTPTGRTQLFKYFEDANGKKYWFEGRRWFAQRAFLEQGAYNLAQLYRLDPVKYADAGKKAAAILTRFAQVYPDYIVKWDYPAARKILLPDFKTAKDFPTNVTGADYASKFSAWGYLDISIPLLKAYDQLAGSDLLDAASREKIETDLFGGMVDFVANHGALVIGNMSPSMWRSQAIAANVLRRPGIAAHILPEMRGLLLSDFTYDGFWRDGTVSYHNQAAGGFQNVFEALYPQVPRIPGEIYYSHLPPDFLRAFKTRDVFRLPNHRNAAINDTWPVETYLGEAIRKSTSHLMPGFGYGILGFGEDDDQLQAHLKFSGRYGHHHYDSLNLLLFARGEELVSDIGYTHTIARIWASSTAGHNTVLVDEKNQTTGTPPTNALGNLLLFNAQDESFQAIEASAPDAYPGLVSDYKRALITIRTPGGAPYVVDIFSVAGGSRHDWILHGSADKNQTLELNASGEKMQLEPLSSLLPADFKWKMPESDQEWDLIRKDSWALGNFRDVAQKKSDANVTATFRFSDEPEKGLQTWMMGAPDSTYSTTRSWSVRHAREDRGKLDDLMRSSLIVRREGAADRFVAVHVPFKGVSPVQRVTQLPWPQNGVALKIESEGVVDYVLYQPDTSARTGNIEGREVSFTGRIALIRVAVGKTTLKMIGGGALKFADQKLQSTLLSAPLIHVQGNVFTVKGGFVISPGEVIIIRHGDKRTTAFRVAKVSKQKGNTLIETEEPAALAGDASGTLKMLAFPHADLAAPHLVTADVLVR